MLASLCISLPQDNKLYSSVAKGLRPQLKIPRAHGAKQIRKLCYGYSNLVLADVSIRAGPSDPSCPQCAEFVPWPCTLRMAAGKMMLDNTNDVQHANVRHSLTYLAIIKPQSDSNGASCCS